MTSLGSERDSFSVVATKDSLRSSFMERKLLTQNSRIIYLTSLFAVFLQKYGFSFIFDKGKQRFLRRNNNYFIL